MVRSLTTWLPLIGLLFNGGCIIPPTRQVNTTPLFVPGPVSDMAWERTVKVLHHYHFSIEKENRRDGTLETAYLTGAGLLEPWHRDSVTPAERLESSLQPIRRKVIVRMQPADGGFYVTVEVIKEREHPREPTRHSPGAATFPESRPLQRDLDLVLGASTPPGWVGLGRDPILEQALLKAIRRQLGR